jgi:DNA replication protein DnaC
MIAKCFRTGRCTGDGAVARWRQPPQRGINHGLVRDLATSTFITQQRNIVLIGGTGTGKTHIAIAIARSCIRAGPRGRFFTTVDLVNRA